MKVFKFGGASIKDANAMRNVGKIVMSFNEPLMIVISAMGKMTNRMEKVVKAIFEKDNTLAVSLWADILNDHRLIAGNLEILKETDDFFSKQNKFIQNFINPIFQSTTKISYDFLYDQIVGICELMSTFMVSKYLNQQNYKNKWVDARQIIATDNTYRMAAINWKATEDNVTKKLSPILSNDMSIITQGFIGSHGEHFTTLGREGSDYTAAILAYCLNAESVTVWKDVDGVLTADPRKVPNATLIRELAFRDAIEMTYYGAQIIHPKTIQPLQDKDIPLYVRSFINTECEGTVVNRNGGVSKVPMIVIADNQYLIQIGTKDFSFIAEHHLSAIFDSLTRFRGRVNLMRNSAISFSVCLTIESQRLTDLLAHLENQNFNVSAQSDLRLITIRNFNESIVQEFSKDRKVIFEEVHGDTYQMILE